MSIKLYHLTKEIDVEIYLTSSKSESNRALIIQALCNNTFNITNLAEAKDTTILNNLLSSYQQQAILDVGHAGTAMRFLTVFLCLQKGEYILTGSARMKQRPIKILVDALKMLGANIKYVEEEGFPPLKIANSNILGGVIQIDGSVSSQYVSALLLIAPQLKNGLTIEFKGKITSKPYINMTIAMMKYFGAEVNWIGNAITVKQGKYTAKNFAVESDWSAASYWYEIAALANKASIKLLGLKQSSLQGDAAVQNIYKYFGVKTNFIKNGIHLTKNKAFNIKNTPLKIEFKNYPDLAQTLAVTCAALNISIKLTGLKTLRIKETDRILALETELNTLGFKVSILKDDLVILPLSEKLLTSKTKSIVNTYNDHRMAMAFAPLALLNGVNIANEQVVVKSYPNFWKDLKKAGFIVEKIK